MSAVIQNEYTGNGSTTTYSFTFPYLKTSDIKASLDGVDTTAFTLPNATTLQFNTAPTNGAKIKIFRQTSVDDLTATFYAGSAIKSEDLNDNFTQNLYKTQEVGARFVSKLGSTMTGDLTMGAGTDIVFEGATDDAHETTLTVTDPTADRTITFPNVTGNVVTTGDTGTVATGMIAGDAVNGDKIADNAINSEHYTDGSIDRVHLAADIVDGTKIADDSINSEHYVDGSIDTQHLANGQITSAKLAFETIETDDISADAITNAKIADNSIDSEHYVDGSIDNAHLASNSVTLAKMADDSVGTAELVDGSVDTARLADNSVTLAKMVDNSVGTSEIVDAAVTTAKLASNAVTTAKITDANVTTAKLAADAVTNDKLANDSVSTENIQDGDISTAKLADSGVTTAKIANDAVTTVKIVNDAITSAKIADDAIGSTELGDGVIDTVHIGSSQITTAKIADSNITTAKITDANVTTAKIANDAITIGKIGCEQTTISDSDSHIPTSGAVVDYVAAQIAPIGGLEVIANEDSFPTTQPSAGVVISISDIEGLITNGSGVATNARTTGNGSDNVTINGFPSSLYSKTMAAGLGLMVSSTGSSQTYTYHKLLAKEADVEQLSNDINDFASRYRVGSSNPTSSLDNGDLFFNTGTGKMLVYNGTNTAWEEVQSIGNFFISTFSEAFDGSRTQFTLSNAPTNVQQVILSLNGVIQKPGTAFTLSGSTVTLASAPASGTDYFAVVMGSTVNIGTPSNNTVSTAVLQDDSVTTAKIAASNVTATELGANAVITSKIADEAVSLAKLEHGTSSNNGKFLRANNGSDPSFETVASATGNVNAIQTTDGSGNLTASNTFTISGDHFIGHDITLNSDSSNNPPVLAVGASGHGGTVRVATTVSGAFGSILDYSGLQLGRNTQYVKLAAPSDQSGQASYTLTFPPTAGSNGQALTTNGSGTASWTTISSDVVDDTSPQLGGNLASNGNDVIFADSDKVIFGDSTDLQIHHAGDNSYIQELGQGSLMIESSGTGIYIQKQGTSNRLADFNIDGDVKLFYNASQKFATTNTGVEITGKLTFANDGLANGSINLGADGDLNLYHDDSDAYFDNNKGDFYIRNDGSSTSEKIKIQAKGGQEGIICIPNGTVELYHSGTKKFETTSTGTTTSGSMIVDGDIDPYSNNNNDLGSSANRWANVYTNDLHLSNEGHSNDVDGTWGNWTIQEGESDLFLKNNRSGKKYKFNLTEVS